jgi:hypothetical protein
MRIYKKGYLHGECYYGDSGSDAISMLREEIQTITRKTIRQGYTHKELEIIQMSISRPGGLSYLAHTSSLSCLSCCSYEQMYLIVIMMFLEFDGKRKEVCVYKQNYLFLCNLGWA